ncbi:MAG: hypothetical protein AAF533_00575 [Acidobacteriota bacterium]
MEHQQPRRPGAEPWNPLGARPRELLGTFGTVVAVGLGLVAAGGGLYMLGLLALAKMFGLR